jgi:hypothetical protein
MFLFFAIVFVFDKRVRNFSELYFPLDYRPASLVGSCASR